MFEIGRLCIKTAGRDSGKKAVIVEDLGWPYFLIDGETRRKRCNAEHLEPLPKVLKIKKGASHEEIAEIFKRELGIELTKRMPKKPAPRPRKKRKALKVKKEQSAQKSK